MTKTIDCISFDEKIKEALGDRFNEATAYSSFYTQKKMNRNLNIHVVCKDLKPPTIGTFFAFSTSICLSPVEPEKILWALAVQLVYASTVEMGQFEFKNIFPEKEAIDYIQEYNRCGIGRITIPHTWLVWYGNHSSICQ